MFSIAATMQVIERPQLASGFIADTNRFIADTNHLAAKAGGPV
jgi:hypothetical protein